MEQVIKITALILIAILICFLPVYFIWNSTISNLFSIREITIWEAFKITVLTSILFKSNTLTTK